MLYKTKPKNFNPKFEIVLCYIEYAGKILLLQRDDKKPEGNTWGAPAGKVDKNDKDKIQALVREIREETGLDIGKYKIYQVDQFYVRYPDYDFISNGFRVRLTEKPNIKINPLEHKGFIWVSPEDALKMNLIEDWDKCIKLYYKI